MIGDVILGTLTPLIVAISMWGVGLSLSLDDFRKIKSNTKVVYFGMAVQLLLVPVFAIFINWIFNFPTSLAIGMVLLASTPGGTTANIVSYLARGNVALNIGLTAINTVLGVFWIPAMVYLGYYLYQTQGTQIPLQFSKLAQVIVLLLVPVSIGIWTRSKFPERAAKLEKHVGKLTFGALMLLLVAGLATEPELLKTYLPIAGIPVLIFNIGCLVFGVATGYLLKLKQDDSIALTMELGIHNCVLALGIAMSPNLLNDRIIAVPAGIYVVSMYLTSIPLALWYRNRKPIS